MKQKSSVSFARRILKGWLDRLERIEEKSPRSQKIPWYKTEYHIAPWVLAVLSTLILYGIVVWGSDLDIYRYVVVGVFIGLMVGFFSYYMLHEHPVLAKSDDVAGLISFIFISSFLIIKGMGYISGKAVGISLYSTPIAIASILAAFLLNTRIAVIISFVMALLLGFLNNFSLELTLVAVVGNVLFVMLASRARTTYHVTRAGVAVGLLQALVILGLAIIQGWEHQKTWINMLNGFAGGIVAAIITLGILPYLEGFFSRMSSLRLLEMADVNHPLLRRMAIEAPGTYHHSMIVANLAADAASAIGANALLCRAGAYYHDIGKLIKSEYFIENQGTYGNPHDQVAPSLSKIVITSHVKEGVALGKSYGLDQEILDFIPQHHGTAPIEYFYQKALKIEEGEKEDKEEVNVETYRYPGPKPQTRESGIVMLADSVEASSRTLEEPNHQRYKDLVYKMINKKLFDGQLEETPLTLKDVHGVAERFVKTLTSINHARIPYPETNDSTESSEAGKISPQK